MSLPEKTKGTLGLLKLSKKVKKVKKSKIFSTEDEFFVIKGWDYDVIASVNRGRRGKEGEGGG